ncbi:DUF7619 domain-containing protein [Psychroserpens damuponensis]|uniref:DUF7619 domain-containing protein n=1 Tax=Psychroserpens damuponensis TaxID=943936 RepID=UPI00058E5A4E|nr:T9SS type A sorting domain-containing protein [Psychroserpens damuponensis]
MKAKLLIPLIALFFTTFIKAQDLTMQNGSWTECDFLLTDSGGADSTYNSNEDFTLTLCSPNEGGYMSINFLEFSTQINQDVLSIYDGTSVNSPLIGSYSGVDSPGFIEANSTSGCLTLHFVSNDAGNTTGWIAEVLCNEGPFVINQPTDYFACDDGNGEFAQFDLSQKNQEILAGLSPNSYAVSYYATLQDADAQLNPLPNIYTNVTNPQTIYVNVMQLSTGNLEQTSFDLVVNSTPIPNLLDVYEICNGTSIIVDSGLNDPNFSYSWYYDGILLSGEYNSTLEVTQTGYYQFYVSSANFCDSFTDFEVVINDFNFVSNPTPLVVCDDDDDGLALFDLESKSLEILNGADNSTVVVTYYETEPDAYNDVNPIASPYFNIIPLSQTVYFRVSTIYGDCSYVGLLELIVDVNCVASSSAIINVCADSPNDIIDVDLTTQEVNMLNGQTVTDYTFTYYLALTNAETQTDAITNPENFSMSANTTTIYVRIEEISTGNFSIESLYVNFNSSLEVLFYNEPNTICSGQEVILSPFVNGASGGNLTYVWSNGLTDQEIIVFEAGLYSVTVTDEITGCSAYGETYVELGETPITTQPDDIIACGSAGVFDLTTIYAQLFNGDDPTNFNISFHLTNNDAFNQANAITIPEEYTAITNPQAIFVNVQNISNTCFSVETFNIMSEDCPIEINCEDAPVNTTYCYEINSADQYTYTSVDGSPVQVIFNSGEVEDGWDELTVVDSDGTVIYSGYGNNGDLTGLTFMSTGDTLTVYVDSDEVFACADQNYEPLDYDVSCFDTTAVPLCTSTLTTPVNGDDNVNENVELTWTMASGLVTGYKLSIGTTSGGIDVFDNEDVGSVLTYDIGTLDYDTTYYVTVIAYNTNGDATGCTEESFTTRPNPNQTIICDDGGFNTTYCYGNNDTSEFSFQSDSGEPLTIFFNSGGAEVNFDEISIIDSNGTVLNSNLPYGNDGDFTGMSFTSSGGTISVVFDTDASVSCATGSACCSEQFDFDVYCSSAVGIIEVNAFIDENTNSMFDVAEPNFSNGYFTYEVNNDGNMNIVNSSTGSFQIVTINETDVYDFTFNLYQESEGCYDITTSIYDSISVANGATETVDFPVIEEQSCEDLAVYLINYWTPPRPGFTHENNLVLENHGFTTIASGTVEFIVDPLLVYNGVTSVNPNYTINNTATGFTVDFVNLQPGAVEYIDISITCPATLDLGDIVTNTANYVTNSNDLVATNNFSTLSEMVVGSWDPNDMRESHGPRVNYDSFVASDEWLYYTIRFQNLGTAAAEFVRIDNALDSQLDETTFQMLRSSHDYVVTRTETDLEWFFEDINLAAEQDDVDASQGFVHFRIKPKSGYDIGDIIPNTASIFFDYNAPIVTNTFNTEFVEDALSVTDSNFIAFNMFPNPAKNVVNIRLNASNFGNVTVNIIDLQGKQVLEQHISEGNNLELDIADLQSGFYFIELHANNKSLVKKLIIE